MRRVMVVGSPGSGKSTFAMRCAALTGLPFVSLDALYWQPGWREPERESWHATVAAAVAQDRWIMDGAYLDTATSRLARADTVVWLDLPRWQCLLGALRRIVTSHGTVRPEMAPGCPEQLDLGFLCYIWNFDRRQRPRIVEMISRRPPAQRVMRFRTHREADDFLAALAPPLSLETVPA